MTVVAFRELGITYLKGSYIWCLHCEQCFKAENVKRTVATKGQYKGYTFYLCPNEGCNGSAIDFFPWCEEEPPILGKRYSGYEFVSHEKEE